MSTYDTTRFTTEPQRCVVPWYLQPEGVPKLYFRDDDYEEQTAFYRRNREARRADIEAVINAHLHQRTDIRVSKKGTDTGIRAEVRTCAAEGCGRTFTPKNPNQMTCGKVSCQKAHKKAKTKENYQQNAEYYREYKRQQRADMRRTEVAEEAAMLKRKERAD